MYLAVVDELGVDAARKHLFERALGVRRVEGDFGIAAQDELLDAWAR
jgi:hypothetical protein